MQCMNIRSAQERDLGQLASIWCDGWQDAHARILPAELARHRTRASFRQRLQATLPQIRVVGSSARPIGFCITKGDELYQLYVSAEVRGSGVAAALLADAEARMSAFGTEVAWLACGIGNERAARFYEKNGWSRVGNMVNELATPDGLFPLEVWRYEKRVKDVSNGS